MGRGQERPGHRASLVGARLGPWLGAQVQWEYEDPVDRAAPWGSCLNVSPRRRGTQGCQESPPPPEDSRPPEPLVAPSSRK